MNPDLDVAIVGAGPYGLAAAARLNPLRTAVFGQPMKTWRTLMPEGMQLRAAWDDMALTASNSEGGLEDWLRKTGRQRVEPMLVEDFISYADWFRGEFVPSVVEAEVVSIEEEKGCLTVSTADGAAYTSRAVVIAVGVTPFAYVPHPFADGIDERVELAVNRRDYSDLAGRHIAVIGAGQTAIEAAASALRAGAKVELLARSRLVWFADHEPHHERTRLGNWLYKLAYPAVGYGPPPINRLVMHPELFAHLPASLRDRITKRLLRPGGSPWLRREVEGKAAVTEGVTVSRFDEATGGLVLHLSDGTVRTVEKTLLATGYRFDLDRLSYLSQAIRNRIAVHGDWPRLGRDFRSTHPAVYFIGYASEGLYGPSARFVLGAQFAAERLAAAFGAGALSTRVQQQRTRHDEQLG